MGKYYSSYYGGGGGGYSEPAAPEPVYNNYGNVVDPNVPVYTPETATTTNHLVEDYGNPALQGMTAPTSDPTTATGNYQWSSDNSSNLLDNGNTPTSTSAQLVSGGYIPTMPDATPNSTTAVGGDVQQSDAQAAANRSAGTFSPMSGAWNTGTNTPSVNSTITGQDQTGFINGDPTAISPKWGQAPTGNILFNQDGSAYNNGAVNTGSAQNYPSGPKYGDGGYTGNTSNSRNGGGGSGDSGGLFGQGGMLSGIGQGMGAAVLQGIGGAITEKSKEKAALEQVAATGQNTLNSQQQAANLKTANYGTPTNTGLMSYANGFSPQAVATPTTVKTPSTLVDGQWAYSPAAGKVVYQPKTGAK